ncbi:hypothetical protein [Mesorhizobium sp. A556]
MASSPTSRLRLMKQATYDNPDSWGVELNQGALDLADEAFGVSEIAVAANVTLTVANYLSDQARRFVLVATGAGGFIVTVPQVDKPYWVVNNCAADITVTPQGGTGAVIRAGTYAMWYCDGTDGFVCDMTLDKVAKPTASLDLNSQKIINLADPVADGDAASKGYIDTLAASSDLGTVAAIAPQIVTLAHIQDGTTATDAITDLAAVAASVALLGPISDDITQLAGMFVGASATDPATRLDGSALQAGDYYLNTAATPTINIYDGSAWNAVLVLALATQAEAEAGTNNTKAMTPLRGVQQIAALAHGYQEFLASAAWTKPATAKWVYVETLGAGGGGGSGRRETVSTSKTGGGGGGGAPSVSKWLNPTELASSVTVTVGAGGTGGPSVTVNGLGVAGTDGGTSSFGPYVSSAGGKGGGGGSSSVSGGDGPGWGSVLSSTKDSGFAGSSGATTDSDRSTIFGGACGGGSPGTGPGVPGSSSVRSGSGGGCGGGESSANALTAPGAGGLSGSNTYGGGGAAGVSHATASTAGGDAPGPLSGGGGGGGNQGGAASRGGNGGLGAGGGGGGGARNNNSGAGGNGGGGRVRVWWG